MGEGLAVRTHLGQDVALLRAADLISRGTQTRGMRTADGGSPFRGGEAHLRAYRRRGWDDRSGRGGGRDGGRGGDGALGGDDGVGEGRHGLQVQEGVGLVEGVGVRRLCPHVLELLAGEGELPVVADDLLRAGTGGEHIPDSRTSGGRSPSGTS